MGALEDLIKKVDDEQLRARLLEEAKKATKHKKFGLVFEEHLPECTPLYDMPIKKGAVVAKNTGSVSDMLKVIEVNDSIAICERMNSKEREREHSGR